ncbi:MAG: hypothetical protein WCW35_08635 [Bacteroidota bacterium]|jgi:chromosome segregation ATPase
MVDQNIDQQSTDAVHSVENALSSLWDKAREASLLISTLREEKKHLIKKIEELEEEVNQVKSLTTHQQTQIEQLRQDLESDTFQKNGSIALEQDEKRILQQKIRNSISKLDQYLTPEK